MVSLKAFHIFFIVASIALSDFFAYWQIRSAVVTRSALDWFQAILSLGISFTLVIYLVWFIRKMKKTP